MKLHKESDLSRRQFMIATGAVASAAAMATVGFSAEKKDEGEQTPKVDVSTVGTIVHTTDVLVVGGGMAGLFAAVKAHDAGAKVMMVSKGGLGTSGQTPFARGIFAFDPATSKVSIDDFVASVSSSAMGTNNPVFTRQLAEHSLERVNDLKRWGFFESALYQKSFAKPLQKRNIRVIERVMLTHLLKKDGKITGAAGLSIDDENVHFYSAKKIILCTGAGGFKPNGFPICDLTHDGSIMAYEIGAKITGKEWNDGHPGNQKNPAAVYNQWQGVLEGKPSVTGVEVRHDLGVELNYSVYKKGPEQQEPNHPPFMAEQIAGGPFRPPGFDQPSGPPPGNRPDDGRPKRGRPPGMGGAPSGGSSAGMSIHKAEGLVPINEYGESNIPGLYAAGDALGSHMAGGIYTQIGSSLAGSAVQGAISGQAATVGLEELPSVTIDKSTIDSVKAEILAPLKRERGYSPGYITETLQGIMIPNFILYIKKEPLLKAALAYIEELRDNQLPLITARDMHDLRLAHETRNMVISAEMKLRASLMRKESRCSHYRLDYPTPDNANWNCWLNIHKDDEGKMVVSKQSFTAWPAS